MYTLNVTFTFVLIGAMLIEDVHKYIYRMLVQREDIVFIFVAKLDKEFANFRQ